MLNQDFREFIELLNANRIRYLVVGGYALAYHGHLRYTKGLDIWIWTDRENAERMVLALRQFGFGSVDVEVDDLLREDYVVQLGYPPRRIDIITGADGLDFNECYPKRVVAKLDGTEVHIIDRINLHRNKLASGWKQDLADVEALDTLADTATSDATSDTASDAAPVE